MNDKPNPQQEAAIRAIGSDMLIAHQVLFKHRHPNATPPFHEEIISLWHSEHLRVLIQAFRGAAKSSIAEEAIIIQACLRRFKNGIILGETYERAVERLRAIKHELENNEFLEQLFGGLVGPTWAEDKIILSNSVIIQCFGRGQSLRGSKHLAVRPDRAFCDDIENKESVATPEAIEKTMDWLMATVMPALEPDAAIRINGTPLHPRSVICQLAQDQDWVSRIYPIERFNDAGERESLWPDRYSLHFISNKRWSYDRLGMPQSYAQEYLCKAEDPATKPFTSEMYRVEPTVRTWQACYAMCDPARTVRATSASTGFAVWSWVGFKLIVWDAFAGFLKPDEIVERIFKIDSEFRPVVLGVETTGLEEFIMQPLRHEQVRRGYSIPIRNLDAPKGKLDFIRGLQPFFKAGEVVFAKECPDARAQFLGFPSGRIDVPNALAYALHPKLRVGAPMYENFGTVNVVDDLPVSVHSPCFLALNSDGRCTTAILLQTIDGGLRIHGDWVREGDPGVNLPIILQEAGLLAQARLRLYAPPHHFAHDNIGLRAAVRLIPSQLGRGGTEIAGREQVRNMLGKLAKARPAVMVSAQARWTLNGFAGGFARDLSKDGLLSQEPVPGLYRVLMEGLESFAALMKSTIIAEEDMPPNYAVSADGRRYLTSRA